MKIQKKELLSVILIVVVGILFTMLMCWNAEQYDKTHPTKDYSYYEYEINHSNK